MSVSRGFILRRFLTFSTARSQKIRLASAILLVIGMLTAIICTSSLMRSGLASYRPYDEIKTENITLEKLPPLDEQGPVLTAHKHSAMFSPLQGCTLDCTATVPGTGNVAVAVSFQSTATASGCATQPTFDWDFGDGTAHSSVQNPSHSYSTAGTFNWTLTTKVNTGATMIDTVVGGFGDGNPIRQAPFGELAAITRDTIGRGIFVADNVTGQSIIRFLNLSGSDVTLAGILIKSGTVRVIAGGGFDIGENTPSLQADLGQVTGLGVSGNGNVLYFSNKIDGRVSGLNLSASNVMIGGASIAGGRIGTLASNFNTDLNGLSVNTTNGNIYVADATAGVNMVYMVTPDGTKTVIAGNGAITPATEPFSSGPAKNIPLLLPRGVKVEPSGSVLISDTGHARVIRVDSGGIATLVHQYSLTPPNINPYPSGIAVQNGNVFTANGNMQTITRVTAGVVNVAGIAKEFCDYTISNCGDGGPGTGAGLNLSGSTASPPLAGIEADGNGLFILDQGQIGRGRIRYLNLTGGAVVIGGKSIPAGAIDTIAGNGLINPYDGGLATGAALNTPVGVAADANGNLWISDTLSAKLRFANRGNTSVTLFAGTAAQQVVPPNSIVTVNKDVGTGPTDGVPVNQAAFDGPQGLFVTSQGVYVADSKNGPAVPPQTINNRRTSLIRFINTTSGTVSIFSGSGTPIMVPAGQIARIAGGSTNESNNGDGGFATNARFLGSSDVVVTANGTIYVADAGQKAVRKIDGSTGIVTSLGLGQATYTGLGLGPDGRLYIANFEGNSILRETAAGSGSFTTLASNISKPRDVAVNAGGIAFVTVSPPAQQAGNNRIVQVAADGTATVIAGSTAGFGGDGGPASAGLININPSDINAGSGSPFLVPETVNIIVDSKGDILFTDSNNNRVRRLSPTMLTCVKTGMITIGGNNPVPQLTSLAPSSALQESGAFTLTVNGSGFVPSSVVRWNGSNRATTYISSNMVTAAILATDLSAPGQASVTVFNAAPGGGTSNALSFTITAPNPVPTLTKLTPDSATEGSPAFTLTVDGTGFVADSVVRWDGQPRMTTFVNSTRLTASILSTDLQGTGQAAVTVFSPAPGGGTSGILNFTINPTTSPAPTLSSINPSSAAAGGLGFTLTATGTNFVASSKVRWNGTDRLTTVFSSTELRAEITAADIANPGMADVTVFTPTPGGGVTSALKFTINPPQANPPTITSISPNVVMAGSQAFTLTVNGTNFVNGSTVKIGTNARTTTFVSATQLTASILNTDLTEAGNKSITVENPSNGGTSNAQTLQVIPVVSVSAASFTTTAIAPESIVAAFGLNLATGVEIATTIPLPTTLLGTVVKVKDSQGVERDAPLFFVAPGQINYQVPPGTAVGDAMIRVLINGVVVATGTMSVGMVGPGLISANSNGQGVSAAVLLRVSNGVQTFEPIARFDSSTNQFVPIPINMGPQGDELYLIIYGTGFRGNTGLNKVTVTIDGVNIPVLYASVAPGFIGLDQGNLGPLSRTLIGKGVVNIIMTVEGIIANTVQMAIQ